MARDLRSGWLRRFRFAVFIQKDVVTMTPSHSVAPAGRRTGQWPRMQSIAIALVCVAIGGVATAAPTNSYIYGIDDANYLWQLDPVSKTSVRVYQTVLTGISNALAYDTSRNDLFAVDGSNDLWWWNAVTDAPVKVATAAQLGLSGTIQNDQPWSAAYYNDSYWFFRGNGTAGTNELSRVVFSYSGTSSPSFTSLDTFTISGTSLSDNAFGDIAIKPDGTLYAYNSALAGRFYSLDLTTATAVSGTGTVGGFNLMSTTTGTGLQLSFNPDHTVLYGHNYDDGKWYEINTSTGGLTEVAGFTSLVDNNKGFRDLGGATIASVPEPSTLMLAGVGVAGMGWVVMRRRRRTASVFRGSR